MFFFLRWLLNITTIAGLDHRGDFVPFTYGVQRRLRNSTLGLLRNKGPVVNLGILKLSVQGSVLPQLAWATVFMTLIHLFFRGMHVIKLAYINLDFEICSSLTGKVQADVFYLRNQGQGGPVGPVSSLSTLKSVGIGDGSHVEKSRAGLYVASFALPPSRFYFNFAFILFINEANNFPASPN